LSERSISASFSFRPFFPLSESRLVSGNPEAGLLDEQKKMGSLKASMLSTQFGPKLAHYAIVAEGRKLIHHPAFFAIYNPHRSSENRELQVEAD
jgi:hypothetical protein